MQAFATPGANTTNKFAVLVKKGLKKLFATVGKKHLNYTMDGWGKTSPESSNFLDGSYSTVAYLCVYRDRDHLESRRDRREKGKYTKVINEYIELWMQNFWEFLSANLIIRFSGRS